MYSLSAVHSYDLYHVHIMSVSCFTALQKSMQKQENNLKQILQRMKFLRDRQPQFFPVKLDQKLAFAGLAETLVYICSQLWIYRNPPYRKGPNRTRPKPEFWASCS